MVVTKLLRSFAQARDEPLAHPGASRPGEAPRVGSTSQPSESTVAARGGCLRCRARDDTAVRVVAASATGVPATRRGLLDHPARCRDPYAPVATADDIFAALRTESHISVARAHVREGE